MSLYRKFINKLPELGHFTARPAAMIDRAYLEEPSSFLGHTSNFIKIRAIYLGFFLPLAVVDLSLSFILAAGYSLSTLLTTDALLDKQLEKLKKFASIFSKNLYVLATSIFGLFSPKLIAFYFTPEKKDLEGVGAGGSYHHAPNAERQQPESIEALQTIVREAIKKGYKIIPVGAGRSQGKQFLPEGGEKAIVIDLCKINNAIVIDAVAKTAIVDASTCWSDIQLQANRHKLALKVMQASNVFSVGGSIGTNIHGWDHITGVLSNTILAMDIVNTKGELETITPDNPLFHQITGGLGLFGIVVSVKIQLTDNELLIEKGTKVTPRDYPAYFHDEVQTNSRIKMHLYRLSLDPKHLLSSGIAVSYVKESDAAPVITPHLSVEESTGTRFNRIMINLARRAGWVRKLYWTGESNRLMANDSKAITTNEIMQPAINAMFNPSVSEAEWLQEYFLPGDKLEGFLNKLGTLLMDNHVPLLNASVRFVKQHDKSPLSYAHDGDRFAVVLCFNQSLQESHLITAKKWLRQAQHLAILNGGTYYLPYQHVSSPEDFNEAYPHAKDAQKFKEEIDPNHVFTSGFHQKYLAPQSPIKNHFKTIMADAQTKKEFEGFLNHVLQRVDSNTFYALLEDIMKYNDSHEEIYNELCKRLPEIMPSTWGSLRRILDSLSAIKRDLGEQAHELLPQETKTINGLVEIGYPGRFVGGFKQQYNVTGNIAAVYEGKSITDYIQTGFPRPFNQFKTLDYSKPNLHGIADKSADVITCYVGLHHFPEAELDALLADIRRVLRDGGHFLLVDHDVIDEQSMSMAHMAHMIFNAVNGVSIKEEMSELRNFQPMAYWKERLAKHGLDYAVEGPDVAMVRPGDPSRNRMVSFVKAPPTLTEVLDLKENVAISVTEPTVAPSQHWRKTNASESTSVGSSPHILLARPPLPPTDAPKDEMAKGLPSVSSLEF